MEKRSAGSTLDDFREWIRELEEIRGQYVKEADGLYVSPLIFRGQSNADWLLATTLERTIGDVSVVDYYMTMCAIQAQVESFTDRRWELESASDYSAKLDESPRLILLGSEYPFMVHLRQHGFPSPLLDWTTSPNIAEFFAFRLPPRDAESVAVFAYVEYSGRAKIGMGGAPYIQHMGPNVRTHRRHFIQQSQYTLCYEQREGRGRHHFCSHESVFSNDPGWPQDLLWKITLPSSLRPEVLAYLEQFNINAFSLFGSEDALMETMAVREYVIRPRSRG